MEWSSVIPSVVIFVMKIMTDIVLIVLVISIVIIMLISVQGQEAPSGSSSCWIRGWFVAVLAVLSSL